MFSSISCKCLARDGISSRSPAQSYEYFKYPDFFWIYIWNQPKLTIGNSMQAIIIKSCTWWQSLIYSYLGWLPSPFPRGPMTRMYTTSGLRILKAQWFWCWLGEPWNSHQNCKERFRLYAYRYLGCLSLAIESQRFLHNLCDAKAEFTRSWVNKRTVFLEDCWGDNWILYYTYMYIPFLGKPVDTCHSRYLAIPVTETVV